MHAFYKILISFSVVIIVFSCKDKDAIPSGPVAVASFTYTPLEDNPNRVAFKSTSRNATSLSWDFGNKKTSSKDVDTIVYSAKGTYKVTLKAIGKAGSNSASQTIVIAYDDICEDGNRIKLSGGCDNLAGKTWVWEPVDIMDLAGPIGGNIKEWWGKKLSEEPDCFKDDEYTFLPNSTFIANTGGEQLGVLDGVADQCVPQPEDIQTGKWDVLTIDNKIMLKISNQLTIGWDDNIGEYEIVEISSNKLVIRKVCCDKSGYRYFILVVKQ